MLSDMIDGRDSTVSSGCSAIEVVEVSKYYRLWNSPRARLKAPLLALCANFLPMASPLRRRLYEKAARHFNDFHALDNITFSVQPGETVGIIGRNGSGKSTLLQLVAGILRATTGRLDVTGRVAGLLELGSGFSPDFSGRENVYLNGAILGLSDQEIDERFDAIVRYADIGAFLDQPLKTYSSGMAMRLAFAVAVHVDADVLIIDEALSVGDARFRKKCYATLQALQEAGKTILFASHDMEAVKRICTSAVLLEEARVLLKGRPNDVVNIYSRLLTGRASWHELRGDIESIEQHEQDCAGEGVDVDFGLIEMGRRSLTPFGAEHTDEATKKARQRAARIHQEERDHERPSHTEYAYGNGDGQIEAPAITDCRGIPRKVFETSERFHVRFCARADRSIPEPIYAMTIKNVSGEEVYGTNTLYENVKTRDLQPGEDVTVVFEQDMNIMTGEHFISLGWTRFDESDELVVMHRRYDVLRFTVINPKESFGIANCYSTITVTG